MARKKTDLHKKIRELLKHTEAPPPESISPLKHFERAVNDSLSALRYIDDHVNTQSIYLAVYGQHMSFVRRMVLGSLIQSFERFIKELATVCVDLVAEYVYDGRFEAFKPSGNLLAANFSSGSVGRALCESGTWMDIDSINTRFRQTLKSAFDDVWDGWVFPPEKRQSRKTQQHSKVKPVDDEPGRRTRTLSILWQVRHTIAHNLGLITRSDATKLQIMVRAEVSPDRVLAPTLDDLRHVKRFLDQSAVAVNKLVGERLAELLTELHEEDPGLFDAKTKADNISKGFAVSFTVDGQVGVV